jgi:hypothetical protein
MERYTTVSLPTMLHKKVNTFIKDHPKLGYGSVAEFAKEAIRMRTSGLREEIKIMTSARLRLISTKSWEEKWEELHDTCKK